MKQVDTSTWIAINGNSVYIEIGQRIQMANTVGTLIEYKLLVHINERTTYNTF